MTKGFLRSVVCAAVCKNETKTPPKPHQKKKHTKKKENTYKKQKNTQKNVFPPPRVSFVSEISFATLDPELQLPPCPTAKKAFAYPHALSPAF